MCTGNKAQIIDEVNYAKWVIFRVVTFLHLFVRSLSGVEEAIIQHEVNGAEWVFFW